MGKVLIITGPTAVGKTEHAIAAARALGGEIISADSMQIYKGFDIGSAGPSARDRTPARHHLIDFADPKEPFTAANYQELALKKIDELHGKRILPIVCGGTGLYINSIMYDMDFTAPTADAGFRESLEQLAAEKGNRYIHDILKDIDEPAALRLHPNNTRRVIRAIEVAQLYGKNMADFGKLNPRSGLEFIVMTLVREREELYKRINDRVDKLMDAGLLGEVEALVADGLDIDDISMKGIGYKELFEYIIGKTELAEAVENVKKNTRRYAKRQLTWFKKYQRGTVFDLSQFPSDDEASEAIINWCARKLAAS